MAASSSAPRPPYSLRGRTCIITGASRGIGREIALTLAREGANIVVAAKSVESQPHLPGTIYSVADECERCGGRALPFQLDVRDEESVERLVQQTRARFGRIDVLVCNAGALWWKRVVDTPMSRFDLVHEINSRGAFACARAVLPTMLAQQPQQPQQASPAGAHIITMSPSLEIDAMPGKVGYFMSKYGMTLLAHGLGRELRGTGVAVNALWPATMIESFATINFRLGDRKQWRRASILADAVRMIVSGEDARTFTGQALIDEDYMRSRGVTDFTKYQCVPGVEPPRLWPPAAASGSGSGSDSDSGVMEWHGSASSADTTKRRAASGEHRLPPGTCRRSDTSDAAAAAAATAAVPSPANSKL